MRKCWKPSQEDPAAVGPSQERECESVKGNPLSFGNEMFMAADHDKEYNAVGLPLPPKRSRLNS